MLTFEETRHLERLTLGPTTSAPSVTAAGTRVANVRGIGAELHDFRHYQPGDDPRFVEWTIYRRLGQLVTRTHRADAHLRVHLLVDVSRSMSLGSPDKLSCARKLASALGYVATRERHAIGLTTLAGGIVRRGVPAAGRVQLQRVLDALDGTSPGGASSIGRALMDFAAIEQGPGLVVVVSDFLDPEDVVPGVRRLLHRGLTPALVQVLAPEERDPTLTGVTELVDVEDATAPPLMVDPSTVAAYRRALAALRDSLGELAATHRLPWVQLASADAFVQMLVTCQRAGLLAARG